MKGPAEAPLRTGETVYLLGGAGSAAPEHPPTGDVMFSAWPRTRPRTSISTPIPAFARIAGQLVLIGWAFWHAVPLLWP
ncbi:hypothetical protein [Amycolatopsis sp. NPDC051372]|uniref:hypothetical protein n=1 Tax=Amycolatopsis sp. NPDC051372 TaxID=3155669 RepID=UPI00341F49E4